MDGSRLRTALRSGKRVYGTLIVSTSPRWVDVVAATALDFLFIDTEHISIPIDTLSWMCHAYRLAGKPVIARIPSPDPYQATKVLDAGATGIIAPYVETPEQAMRVGTAIKRRPLRGAALGAAVDRPDEVPPALASYLDSWNADNVFVANIESPLGIRNLDAILELGVVDAVLVGPHDLTTSLGVPEKWRDERFEAAVETIIRTARRHNVGAGVHATYESCIDQEVKWAGIGANLMIHRGDILLFASGINHDIAALRARLGDTAGTTGGDRDGSRNDGPTASVDAPGSSPKI